MRSFLVVTLLAALAAANSNKEVTTGVSQMCESMGFVKHTEGRQLLSVADPATHTHATHATPATARKVQLTPRFKGGLSQDPSAAASPKDLVGKSLGGDTMLVGVCPYPPYAYEKEGSDIPDPTAPDQSDWTGFSVEIFELVAKQQKMSVKYVNGTYEDLVAKLETGEIDTLAPGMFLTKRVRHTYTKWGFSGAYWQAGISILIATHKGGNVFTAVMGNVEMWTMIFVLLFTLVGAGHVFWLIERLPDHEDKMDEDGNFEPGYVPKGYLSGVFAGTWWSAATITTVGYGDAYPKTWGGRCWAVTLMIVSLFLVGLFTGAITSAMTLATLQETDNGITSLKELDFRPVAVLAGSFPAHYMNSHSKAVLTEVDRMRDATDALLAGKVDAIVGIADVLRYQAVKNPGTCRMVGYPFSQHSLVWPFPDTSKNLQNFGGNKVAAALFSQSLLQLEDTVDGDQVINKYFGDH